jgi:hypothetical protein
MAAADHDTHLGLAVYRWGAKEQDDLLIDCLGPEVRRLRDQGLVSGFRFDRFDTRGPHIAAVLTLPRSLSGEVAERLSARLAEYLAAYPSVEGISTEQLERRHRECRGKLQFEADCYEGWAANDSFCVFEHDPEAYFLSPSLGVAPGSPLWTLLDDLAFWSISRLRRKPQLTAISWYVALDRSLRSAVDPAAYWRYHASTLILDLETSLRAHEPRVLAALPAMVLPRNYEMFSGLWPRLSVAPAPWPHLDRLVELALAEGQRLGRGWLLLREIIHSTIKQLSLPVAAEIPLVLFLWHRNLPVPAPAPTEVVAC